MATCVRALSACVMQVFNLVNLIFDRLAESVKPFTGTILQLLPDLWRQSEDQSLLRIQACLASCLASVLALYHSC